MFPQEGIVTHTYIPPNILKLFYISQDYKIAPKVKVTANPGGILNIDVTSLTETLRLNKNISLFSSLKKGGIAIGLGVKKPEDMYGYDYVEDKHSLTTSWKGLIYTYQKDGVNVIDRKSNNDFEYKLIDTLQCDTKTIRSEGILITAGAALGISELAAGAVALGEAVPVIGGLLQGALTGTH